MERQKCNKEQNCKVNNGHMLAVVVIPIATTSLYVIIVNLCQDRKSGLWVKENRDVSSAKC